jgi:uncharacterized membrane protein YdjX (TVP38/TMEM64 family)
METLVRETAAETTRPSDIVPTGPASRPWWRTRAAYRFGALTLLLLTLFAVMIVVHPTRQAMAGSVDASNTFAPAIAVGGAALLTAALAPRTLLSAVGGLLFGWMHGAGYILCGVTLGAIGAYLVGRLLGREFMARHLKGRGLRLEQAVTNKGVLAVALSRMVPCVPFGISNYVFGTTSVRFAPFVLGTVLGATPATIAYAALGSATAHHNTAGMTAAGAVVATLGISGSIATVVMWRRRPRRHTVATIPV